MAPPLRSGATKLPNSWNTSFSRAVESLEKRGLLQVTDRPLANLAEWRDHYPGKTLNVEARELRRVLIPVLIEWIEGPEGPSPRYSKSENEHFALKQFNQTHVAKMAASWKVMKPDLLTQLGHSHRQDLFLLIARGTQIFEANHDVSSRRPFRSLADDCLSKGLLPALVVADMKKLITDLLTAEEAGALNFRSYMHALTKGVPSRGHCELSLDAKEELYLRMPSYISGLAGFKLPPSKKSIDFFIGRGRATHGPILKKVLDQSVFQNFRFLEIPPLPPSGAKSKTITSV